MRAVLAVVRATLRRRRVQTGMLALVALLSSATATLALALLVESTAPFDRAYAAQRGAQVQVGVDVGGPPAPPPVAGATTAGPFAQAAVDLMLGGVQFPRMSLAGRDSPDGPVDELALLSGRWVRAHGEVVLGRWATRTAITLGSTVTVAGAPGRPTLVVVGFADSVTGTADGWVRPADLAGVSSTGKPDSYGLLYRTARSPHDVQLLGEIRAATAGLSPRATVVDAYATAKTAADDVTGPIVPFVAAFGVLGLAMSIFVVTNVVSGVVVTDRRRIGVLRALGFTPGQVTTGYGVQIIVPAVLGAAAGLVVGNLLALPTLDRIAVLYGLTAGGLAPPWVDAVAAATVLAVMIGAAALPAIRAGRLPAVVAITTGRAPQPGRGLRVQRFLSRSRLPRPLSLGLGGALVRPARTATTAAAVLLGTAAITLALGIGSTFQHAASAETRAGGTQLVGYLPPSASTPDQAAAAQRELARLPKTEHAVIVERDSVSVPGIKDDVRIYAYRGDASWTGWPLVSGRWISGPGEALAPTHLLHLSGVSVGQSLTLRRDGRSTTVRIVGELFATGGVNALSVITDARTLATVRPGEQPYGIEIRLRPGAELGAYAREIQALPIPVRTDLSATGGDSTVAVTIALSGLLAVILGAVAALGVFNTVVLQTKEQSHTIGVLRSLGLTPRQTTVMTAGSVAVTGLLAGIAGTALGTWGHHVLVRIIAEYLDTDGPSSFVDIYPTWQYLALPLTGAIVAVLGALVPAIRAGRARLGNALHTE